MKRKYRIKVSIDVDVTASSIDDAIDKAHEVATCLLGLNESHDWQYHVTHMGSPLEEV